MTTLTVEQEQLVVDNIRLVDHLAKRYYHQSLQHEDLVNEGVFGLIKAAKNFNQELGFKFATFAGRCIQNELGMVVRKPQVKAISLNKAYDDEVDAELIDLIVSDANVEYQTMINVDLPNELQQLNNTELFIIINTYGLFGRNCMKQIEIAKVLKTTQPQVSKITSKALRKMRKYLEGDSFENCWNCTHSR